MPQNKAEKRRERAQGYQDKMEQRLVDRQIGREAREQRALIPPKSVAEQPVVHAKPKPSLVHHAKRMAAQPDAMSERQQGYQDKQKQKLADRMIGREARELAVIRGDDPLHTAIRQAQPSQRRKAPPVQDRLYKQSKEHALGMPEIDKELQRTLAVGAKKDDASYRVSGKGIALSREGKKGKFDEDYPGGKLFWRADTRPPNQVLKTGFSPKVERDMGKQSGKKNTIVFRTGDDDIVPATGVSIARDIRGAAFFPFSTLEKPNEKREERAYLYAVNVKSSTSTYRAQKAVDRGETASRQWRDPARHTYDPKEVNSEHATSVWPFMEHAAHRIKPDEIVGSWRLHRSRLVAPEQTGDDVKAGMRFRLGQKNLISGRKKDPRTAEAQHYVKSYGQTYPKQPSQFLSYQGIVEKRGKAPIKTAGDAEVHARQLDPFPPGAQPFRPARQQRREKLEARAALKQGKKQSSGNNSSRTKNQSFR